jgi:hypothetical protein
MVGPYLMYNNQFTAFVGYSAEYLPHVGRPSWQSKYCTYDTALATNGCIDQIAKYANKTQIHLAINQSVGKADGNLVNAKNPGNTTVPVPYDHEQPFVWDGQKWHLDQYDDNNNPDNFFSRLNQVIARAGAEPDKMVVEVTLVDWEPNTNKPGTSPWTAVNNVIAGPPQSSIQFSSDLIMVSFDNVSNDLQPANIAARTQQKNMIIHAVQQLNGNPNFYWEIANEPDQSPGGGATVNVTAMLNWHHWVAKFIHDTEAVLPNQHLVGANLWTKTALDNVLSHPDPNIQIINGHYVRLQPTSGTMYGAIPEAAIYYPQMFQTIFGFNEGQATPCPSLAGSRAEALEFLLGGGGTYDNYSLDRSSTTVLGYMNFVRQFMASLELDEMQYRPPYSSSWIVSGLPPTYGASDGTGQGNSYFTSLDSGDEKEYVLYLHHSTVPTTFQGKPVRFNRYAPFCNQAGYHTNLTLSLLLLYPPGYYRVEWFVPKALQPTDSLSPACSQSVYWSGSGSFSVMSPGYPYDVLLKVTACSGTGPCTTNVPCNTVAVAPCPPPDPSC